MEILYPAHWGAVKKEVEKDSSFMLTNKIGGYLMVPNTFGLTRYCGFHLPYPENKEWGMKKALHSINRKGDIRSCEFSADKITRVYQDHSSEQFRIVKGVNGLIYSSEGYEGPLNLIFDCRRIYDFSDTGRIYKRYTKDGHYILRYTKYKGESLREENYSIFTAIKNSSNIQKVDSWFQTKFRYDNRRESDPVSMFLYHALDAAASGRTELRLGFGSSESEAIREVHKLSSPTKPKDPYFEIKPIEPKDHDIRCAYYCAAKSLDDLHCTVNEQDGLYAGLPWFFQFWSRDQAISTRGLMKLDKTELTLKILQNMLNESLDDGRVSNRTPRSELGSADGIGWLALRIHQLIKEDTELFDYETLKQLYNLIHKNTSRMIKNYGDDELIRNNHKETWMDTTHHESQEMRSGFRIEIQCLQLRTYRLLYDIARLLNNKVAAKHYKDLEKQTAKRTKKMFYEKGHLKDGIDDPTIRPNVFLACYIYPDLLSRREWTKVFDKALSQLWLDWGGLATIDTDSELFCHYHTGENNKSYHHGDSWYFVNNIAAIAMHRIDSKKYKDRIEKILKASTKDILTMGSIGCASEISSAEEQEAMGCFSQAWSAGTYIELVRELKK